MILPLILALIAGIILGLMIAFVIVKTSESDAYWHGYEAGRKQAHEEEEGEE